MIKHFMEQEAMEFLANEKSRCGCYYNYDDKFEVLCDEHQAEADEADREYQWAIYEDAAR